MKIAYRVIIGFFSAIISILSLVFIVIEGRLLFSGDWLIYDNVALGFFKYFFRFIIALFALTYTGFEFANIKLESPKIMHYLFVGNIALIIMSIVLVFNSTNMVGEIALLISILPVITKVIFALIKKKINSKSKEKE